MPGSQRTVAGSNVGKSSISGAISALEKYRLNRAYLHKDDPESQITLRSDVRIRQFEEVSKSNEPKRVEQAQMLKAIGTSSGEIMTDFLFRRRFFQPTKPPADNYTPEELTRCSLWCLTHFRGTRHVYNGVRDRAMLLLSAATAFRGDSARRLLWSDMFVALVPIDDLGLGTVVPVRPFCIHCHMEPSSFCSFYPRRLGCSLMAPNTISKVELMSMVHSVTVSWITAQLAGRRSSCLPISMCSVRRSLSSHLTSKMSHVVNMDGANGMITTCSGRSP